MRLWKAKEAGKEEEDAAEQKEGSRVALPSVIHKPKRPSDFTVYTGYLELDGAGMQQSVLKI